MPRRKFRRCPNTRSALKSATARSFANIPRGGRAPGCCKQPHAIAHSARRQRAPCSGSQNITYSVEGRPLFEGASANIPTGHKVGLVGRNGTGKTTLFRLIRGELALEGGEIALPTRARIGGVAQEVPASARSR